MKIGISSWAYAWNIKKEEEADSAMNAFELLEKAHEVGAEVLQIADNLPLEALSKEELLELREKAAEYGIILECGTQGVRPERLIPFIELAEFLGVKLLRTLLHDALGCPTLSEAEGYIREALPHLHRSGITLAIENHDFFPVSALRTLVEKISDSHVGICLDPVNNFAKGEGTKEVLDTLKDYTVNFHLKDYTVRRKPGGLGFDVEGCVAGDGLLDLGRCQKALTHEPMSYILELWTPKQESLPKTRALEKEWVVRSMAYLKAYQKDCQ